MRSYLVRLPAWREGGRDVGDDEDDIVWMVVAFLQWLVIGLLVPLVLIVLETPIAVARGLRRARTTSTARRTRQVRVTGVGRVTPR